MASGLRRRPQHINYAGLEFEAEDDDLPDPVCDDDDEDFKVKSYRRHGHHRDRSSTSSKDATKSPPSIPGSQKATAVPASTTPVATSGAATAAVPTTPEASISSSSQLSAVTSPVEDQDVVQAVCGFCGTAEAPKCFGDSGLDHFSTSTDFRLSHLRRGPLQAPMGSLSTDKLSDHKFRPRHGAHESRQSRRGNFIWAHRACAQWSEGVFSDHGKLIGVDEAVLRGLSERCCICQNTGATITCRSARCRHAYHLPCAALDSSYLDGETMTIICPDHLDDVCKYVGDRGSCCTCKTLDDPGEMLFCLMCNEHQHAGCIGLDVPLSQEKRASWQCSECQVCSVCRTVIAKEDMKALCVSCTSCSQMQHIYCLDPPLKKKAVDWRCERCRECKDCGCKTAGSGPTARWHKGYTQCSACYQRALKVRPCAVCEQTCIPSKDLKCATCSKYMHSDCVTSVPADPSFFRCDSCTSLVGSLRPSRREDMPAVVVKIKKQRFDKAVSSTTGSGGPSSAHQSDSGDEEDVEMDLDTGGHTEGGDKVLVDEMSDTSAEKTKKTSSRPSRPASSSRRKRRIRRRRQDRVAAQESLAKSAAVSSEAEDPEQPVSDLEMEFPGDSDSDELECLENKVAMSLEPSPTSPKSGATAEVIPVQADVVVFDQTEVFTEATLEGEVIMTDDFCAGNDAVVGYVEQEVGSNSDSSSSSESESEKSQAIGASEDDFGVRAEEEEDTEDVEKEEDIVAALQQTAELEQAAELELAEDQNEGDLQSQAIAEKITPTRTSSSRRVRSQRPRRPRQPRPKKSAESHPPPPPEEDKDAKAVALAVPESPREENKDDPGVYLMDTAILIFAATNQLILTSDICSACGSIGKDEEAAMLCCMQCGQCFHPFCVNAKINKITLSRGWRCLMCMVCEGCGSPQDEEHLLLCDSCDVSYHTYCLKPKLNHVPEGSWKCKWCVQCLTCGSSKPGFNCEWYANYTRCGPCASKIECLVCERPYKPDDMIILCEHCRRWSHASCHSLNNKEAVTAALNGPGGFICKLCVRHGRKLTAEAAAKPPPSSAVPALPPPSTSSILPQNPVPGKPKALVRKLTVGEEEQLKILEEYNRGREEVLGCSVTTAVPAIPKRPSKPPTVRSASSIERIRQRNRENMQRRRQEAKKRKLAALAAAESGATSSVIDSSSTVSSSVPDADERTLNIVRATATVSQLDSSTEMTSYASSVEESEVSVQKIVTQPESIPTSPGKTMAEEPAAEKIPSSIATVTDNPGVSASSPGIAHAIVPSTAEPMNSGEDSNLMFESSMDIEASISDPNNDCPGLSPPAEVRCEPHLDGGFQGTGHTSPQPVTNNDDGDSQPGQRTDLEPPSATINVGEMPASHDASDINQPSEAMSSELLPEDHVTEEKDRARTPPVSEPHSPDARTCDSIDDHRETGTEAEALSVAVGVDPLVEPDEPMEISAKEDCTTLDNVLNAELKDNVCLEQTVTLEGSPAAVADTSVMAVTVPVKEDLAAVDNALDAEWEDNACLEQTAIAEGSPAAVLDTSVMVVAISEKEDLAKSDNVLDTEPEDKACLEPTAQTSPMAVADTSLTELEDETCLEPTAEASPMGVQQEAEPVGVPDARQSPPKVDSPVQSPQSEQCRYEETDGLLHSALQIASQSPSNDISTEAVGTGSPAVTASSPVNTGAMSSYASPAEVRTLAKEMSPAELQGLAASESDFSQTGASCSKEPLPVVKKEHSGEVKSGGASPQPAAHATEAAQSTSADFAQSPVAKDAHDISSHAQILPEQEQETCDVEDASTLPTATPTISTAHTPTEVQASFTKEVQDSNADAPIVSSEQAVTSAPSAEDIPESAKPQADEKEPLRSTDAAESAPEPSYVGKAMEALLSGEMPGLMQLKANPKPKAPKAPKESSSAKASGPGVDSSSSLAASNTATVEKKPKKAPKPKPMAEQGSAGAADLNAETAKKKKKKRKEKSAENTAVSVTVTGPVVTTAGQSILSPAGSTSKSQTLAHSIESILDRPKKSGSDGKGSQIGDTLPVSTVTSGNKAPSQAGSTTAPNPQAPSPFHSSSLFPQWPGAGSMFPTSLAGASHLQSPSGMSLPGLPPGYVPTLPMGYMPGLFPPFYYPQAGMPMPLLAPYPGGFLPAGTPGLEQKFLPNSQSQSVDASSNRATLSGKAAPAPAAASASEAEETTGAQKTSQAEGGASNAPEKPVKKQSAGINVYAEEERRGVKSGLAQIVYTFTKFSAEVQALQTVKERFRFVKAKWKDLEQTTRKEYMHIARINRVEIKSMEQAQQKASEDVKATMLPPSQWLASHLETPPGVPQPPPLIHEEHPMSDCSPGPGTPLVTKSRPQSGPVKKKKPPKPAASVASACALPATVVPPGPSIMCSPMAMSSLPGPSELLQSANDSSEGQSQAEKKKRRGHDSRAAQDIKRLVKKMVNEVDYMLQQESKGLPAAPRPLLKPQKRKPKEGAAVTPSAKKKDMGTSQPSPAAASATGQLSGCDSDSFVIRMQPPMRLNLPGSAPNLPPFGAPLPGFPPMIPQLQLQQPDVRSILPCPPAGFDSNHYPGMLRGEFACAYVEGIDDFYNSCACLPQAAPLTPPTSPLSLIKPGKSKDSSDSWLKLPKLLKPVKLQKPPKPPKAPKPPKPVKVPKTLKRAPEGTADKPAKKKKQIVKETPSISPIAAVIPDAQPSPSTSEGSTPVTSGDSPLLPSVPTPRPVAKKAGWRLWTPGFAGGGKKVKQLAGIKDVPFLLRCSSADQRKCSVCYGAGDGDMEGAGRLLNSGVDQWLHANCAIWSSEVREVQGQLENVSAALKRIKSTVSLCSICSRAGCGVACFACARCFHVQCAWNAGHHFYRDKTVMCNSHNAAVSDLLLQSIAVHRRCVVQRSMDEELSQLDFLDGSNVIRIGNTVVVSLGQLVTQLPTFHSRSFIYPVGFRVTKLYWSRRAINRRCYYHCTIINHKGAPRFVVDIEESGFENVQLSDASLTDLWEQIAKPINTLRRRHRALKLFTAYVSGEEFFGLSQPLVKKILESLPGAEQLESYAFTSTRPNISSKQLPLPLNPTGSARSQPYINTRHKRVMRSAGMISTTSHQSHQPEIQPLQPGGLIPYEKQFFHTKANQFRRLRQEWRNNVVLGRSLIQGLGLFAKKDFEVHSMIIEYVGVVIRNEVANKRECEYNETNRGCYMFRIDADHVVDATNHGGLARYINHSCEPNCLAEIVTIDKEKKIVIMSGRRIAKGEELTYDYKFEIESEQQKIPCLCQAGACKKWMN